MGEEWRPDNLSATHECCDSQIKADTALVLQALAWQATVWWEE